MVAAVLQVLSREYSWVNLPRLHGPRQYVVGDVIHLTMDVVHYMNLTEARAVFAHATFENVAIVLEGEPEIYSTGGPFEEGVLERNSFVVMNEEVTLEYVPGVYRFSYVEFETASLRAIRPEDTDFGISEEDKALEIVADRDNISVSVTLEAEQTRPLDHEELRSQFESLEDPGENEE